MARYFLSLIFFIICISVIIIAKNTQVAADSLFRKKCSVCHILYKPSSYSLKQWQRQVSRMAPRAKITEKQKQMIISLHPKTR